MIVDTFKKSNTQYMGRSNLTTETLINQKKHTMKMALIACAFIF